MKKYFCLLLLLIAQLANAQNIDSLKTVLKLLQKQNVTIARDSNITNTIVRLFDNLKIGDLDNQKLWADSLKRFSKTSKWEKALPKSLIYEGLVQVRKGFYTEGILNFENAAKLFQKYNDNKEYASAINNLSVAISNEVFFNEKIDKVYLEKYQKYLINNLEIIKKSNNPRIISNQETILGLFYFSKKDYKKAYFHYENSEKASKVDTVKYFYGYYGGMWAKGLCLIYMGKTKEGFKYINYAKKACEKPQERGMEHYLKAVIGLFLGNYYIEKKDYKDALETLKEGEISKKITGNTFFDKHYAKAFFTTYKNLGNYKKSLEFHEFLQKINTSEEEIRFKEKYTEYQLKYDDEKRLATIKTLENEKLLKENEKKDLISNVLIFSLLAGLGFVVFIYQNNLKLTQKNKQLSTKNKEIEEALFKGQTIERKRIGVELHDNLSAKIGAIRWRLESLEPKFEDNADTEFYNTTINALNETYADVRLIAHNLLPDILVEKGFIVASQSLVNELNSINKTKFIFETFGEEKRYSNKIEYELYSILLELSNNILKHAKAKSASISIYFNQNELKLVVKDDGIGFGKTDLQFGMGLSNIKSRLESINGSLHFESENGLAVEMNIKV